MPSCSLSELRPDEEELLIYTAKILTELKEYAAPAPQTQRAQGVLDVITMK